MNHEITMKTFLLELVEIRSSPLVKFKRLSEFVDSILHKSLAIGQLVNLGTRKVYYFLRYMVMHRVIRLLDTSQYKWRIVF